MLTGGRRSVSIGDCMLSLLHQGSEYCHKYLAGGLICLS